MSVRYVNGYRMIYMPNHPEAVTSGSMKGYVYEHRMIAEGFMNRSLRPEEDVHHLNELRYDNDPDNLLVLEASQHSKLHKWINKNKIDVRSLETSVELSICLNCDTVVDYGRQFCSRECDNEYRNPVKSLTPEELAVKVFEKPMNKLAEEFNCSESHIRRLCRKNNIITPNCGYWNGKLY